MYCCYRDCGGRHTTLTHALVVEGFGVKAKTSLQELEKRLFRYAKVGAELLEMADEGLVLAARAKARLGQFLSAAQHTEGQLRVVGVGEWRPTSTCPAWNAEPRLPGSEEGS
jgi:hypothetical protein